MKKVKIKVCTGKKCRNGGSEKLLAAVGCAFEGRKDDVKLKEVGCLGHCGKKKHGEPPFAEVDGDIVAHATEVTLVQAVDAARARA